MSFFTSEYECKLDDKGRLSFPARIRSSLPKVSTNELIVRLGFEPCLVIYPMVEFKKIYHKIVGLSEFNAQYRKLQRSFFRGNAQVELDKSGRINLPKSMLNYAGIEKEVVLVGLGNRIELWNPEKYQEYLVADQETLSEMAEEFLL